jgi:site-specific DNA recombinase
LTLITTAVATGAPSSATTRRRARARPGGQPQAPAGQVLRVAGYARASTDEGNQPYTVDMQQEKIQAYCHSQDNMELVATYEERASGKDIEGRPELMRLLEDVAEGKFDAVVVYKVDRWSRLLADLLATIDFLDRHAVRFASVTEPIDTSTPMGRMVLQMLGSFAEFERGLIVERVISGIEAKVAKGLPLTGKVGFGLRVDHRGVVEPDPATFGVVLRIFKEYTEDLHGTKTIALGLQADAMPTPGKAPWSAPAVARVLRSRTFIGELPFRDGWVPGAHEPLLDPELFEKAQRLADQRSTQAGAARSKGDFILSGTIVCGHCAAAYSGTTGTSGNGNKVRYYSCTTARRYGKKSCAAPSVPADELETLVTDALLETYADSTVFTAAVAEHAARRQTRTGPLNAELDAAKSEESATSRKLERYRDDYESERINGATYQEAKTRLEAGLSRLGDRIARLELDLAAHEVVTLPSEADRKALHAILVDQVRTGAVPARKALFTALVEKLEVHDLDDVRPTFRLGGPDLAELAAPAGDGPGFALAGEMFASRASGWS